ncbi:hypothetical protein C8J56DRAFT_1027162 [Mycena floridula]|nr:hypothetical protein C8J56DRAFT_1027162 [Mycena floridula]
MCEGLLPSSDQIAHQSMNMPGLFQPKLEFAMLDSEELMTLPISELFKLAVVNDNAHDYRGSQNRRASKSQSRLCRDDIVKELKRFFIRSFERLGVDLHGTEQNKRLPWSRFDDILNQQGIHVVNWPEGVPTPGNGPHSNKGLAGVPLRDLRTIYEAVHHDTAKLDLRRIPATYTLRPRVADSSTTEGSKKRSRDPDNEGDTRPRKTLVIRDKQFDSLVGAWKICICPQMDNRFPVRDRTRL